jgi:hypothetical protein
MKPYLSSTHDDDSVQIRDPHRPEPHPLADRIQGSGTSWTVKPEWRGGIPRERKRK